MKRYLVGGAVRDALLGLPNRENDWVVVGATPEEMRAAGYRPVGKDFPVFLHPQTHEEYALARTERKTGRGYHGFAVDASAAVTLEDDLLRRDLTVNAIARDDDGSLIDPHGGARDIEARVLRHVSAAFAEDPVRILRVARFAARFAPLGFSVAGETMDLMRGMVAAGEVDHLVPERVWKETERALMCERPDEFVRVLRECGALARLMPEVDALFGVPQRLDFHPEGDTGIHLLLCLQMAARLQLALPGRVAVLLHDLGKALTPADVLPRHPGHDAAAEPLVRAFCERLKVPNEPRDVALAVARDHILVHRVQELRAGTVLELLERLQALRAPAFFEQALLACESDARGRKGLSERPYPSADFLRGARAAIAQVQARDVMVEGLSGPQIGEKLRDARLRALAQYRKEQSAAGPPPSHC